MKLAVTSTHMFTLCCVNTCSQAYSHRVYTQVDVSALMLNDMEIVLISLFTWDNIHFWIGLSLQYFFHINWKKIPVISTMYQNIEIYYILASHRISV